MNFSTHDASGIEIRRKHTRNGHNTHLVSESLSGAALTLAVQAASPGGVGASEAGGTEVLRWRTQPPLGPTGPGTQEERQLTPWKEGQGLAAPKVPSFKHGFRAAFSAWSTEHR